MRRLEVQAFENAFMLMVRQLNRFDCYAQAKSGHIVVLVPETAADPERLDLAKLQMTAVQIAKSWKSVANF